MAGFVPYAQRDSYLLNDVPHDHMWVLRQRAKEHDTSLTNIAGQALANRYGLDFEPSERRNVVAFRPNILLKLPEAVMTSVRHEAALRSVTIRTVILDALSDSFGLKRPAPTIVDPARRPGRPKGT